MRHFGSSFTPEPRITLRQLDTALDHSLKAGPSTNMVFTLCLQKSTSLEVAEASFDSMLKFKPARN